MKCSLSGCGAYARITDIYACRDLRPVSKEMDLPRRKILHWHTCFACRDLRPCKSAITIISKYNLLVCRGRTYRA